MDPGTIYLIVVIALMFVAAYFMDKKESEEREKNQNKNNGQGNIILPPVENKITQNIQKAKPLTVKQNQTVPKKSPTINLNMLNQYGVAWLYHITHIENLNRILALGLLSNITVHNDNLVRKDISEHGVQERRNRQEPIFKKSIHYYVPLYFTPRNPMLFVRKNIQQNLAILLFRAEDIFCRDNVIFTDGNAASDQTNFYSSLNDLGELDWVCLRPKSYWNDFPGGKRKRCAEVLVPKMIPPQAIKAIKCYNKLSKLKIENIVKNKIMVEVDEKIYF